MTLIYAEKESAEIGEICGREKKKSFPQRTLIYTEKNQRRSARSTGKRKSQKRSDSGLNL